MADTTTATVTGAGAPKSDALLPQAAGGNAKGAALALLVHAGLITALALGVDWRTSTPEAVSAELWAAVPQVAAPAAVEPAPTPAPAPPPPPVPKVEPVRAEPPPKPDIAIEQERLRKAEQERRQTEAEKLKADKAEKAEQAADKKREADKAAREKADAEQMARQRQENLRRMMGQAGGAPGQATTAGTAAQNAAPSASYAGKVKAAVQPNIVYTGNSSGGNSAAEVEVNAAPGGTIISRRLARSSGNKEWDEAVLRAIDKTQAMPRDTDGRVPASLLISFRQNE